jgi:hypothetical protein
MLIAQAQRAVATNAPNAAELRVALDTLRQQQQASSIAMGRQDYAAGNQALQEMDDALATIEKAAQK